MGQLEESAERPALLIRCRNVMHKPALSPQPASLFLCFCFVLFLWHVCVCVLIRLLDHCKIEGLQVTRPSLLVLLLICTLIGLSSSSGVQTPLKLSLSMSALSKLPFGNQKPSKP